MEESQEEEEYVYIPILQDHKQLLKERWKFWLRKGLFYVLLTVNMMACIKFPFLITNLTTWFALVHVLWFELDLAQGRNSILIQFFHGMSFVGSYTICVLATLLIFVFNPGFLEERSKKEHHSVAIAWLLFAWSHWLPPILLSLDLYLNLDLLQRRHRLTMFRLLKEGQEVSKITMVRQTIRILVIIFTPIALISVWYLAGFTPQKVYDTTNLNYGIGIPVGLVTNILAGAVLVYFLKEIPNAQKRVTIGG
eukprot:TRINITY_DN6336_c0_g1_i1.p1 TRINITY_DN6336_c0_g1~~TRINITY_DN6336_c0_g1_i1.p1  ORF type:complete len:251 (-),score=22.71 TRINITY_DN6336_c0_g1_i1:18-770(-)